MWTLAFRQFFDIQLFFSMILVLLVGPDLISQDLRFNAIPLYLSRPLRRFEYFLGKLGRDRRLPVGGDHRAGAAGVRAGYGFSLDPTVIRDTARLLVASLAFGTIVVVSAGLLMLAFSSLSRNSRYVGAMWLGFWLVGNMRRACWKGPCGPSGARWSRTPTTCTGSATPCSTPRRPGTRS